MEKHKLAQAVRKASEIYAEKHASEYIEPKTLCGMCAISSYALLELFQKYKMEAVCHEVVLPLPMCDKHVYLVHGKEAWDVTASQFTIARNELVKVVKIPHWIYSPKPYKIHKALEDFSKWNQEQRPTRERVDELLSYVELEDVD